MPYVDQETRRVLDPLITQLGAAVRMRPFDKRDGATNYAVSRLLLLAMADIDRSWNYERIERAVGVLECAKLELYRKLAAPYEDKKAAENGEVYP